MNSLVIKATSYLREGKVVAFPTETVYGLGADAKNPQAIQEIYRLKMRPSHHPLIVHIAQMEELAEWACDIPQAVYKLGALFWPGPLTVILKKAPGISLALTGGQESIGLRIPNHPLALALLKEFGRGIAAPSANRFGRVSATTATAVQEEFGENNSFFLLDGGQCQVGVESTIIDMREGTPIILRPGAILKEEIFSIIPKKIKFKPKNSPRVPGALASHYAPITKITLISSVPHFLDQESPRLPCALLMRGKRVLRRKKNIDYVCMPPEPKAYAFMLYQTLRDLDKKNYHRLVIELPPNEPEWETILDRLQRAAT